MSYITNIDTLSALLDRLISENIKLHFFRKEDVVDDIEHQENLIEEIKYRITQLLLDTYSEREYKYISEKRTYKPEDIVETLEELNFPAFVLLDFVDLTFDTTLDFPDAFLEDVKPLDFSFESSVLPRALPLVTVVVTFLADDKLFVLPSFSFTTSVFDLLFDTLVFFFLSSIAAAFVTKQKAISVISVDFKFILKLLFYLFCD